MKVNKTKRMGEEDKIIVKTWEHGKTLIGNGPQQKSHVIWEKCALLLLLHFSVTHYCHLDHFLLLLPKTKLVMAKSIKITVSLAFLKMSLLEPFLPAFLVAILSRKCSAVLRSWHSPCLCIAFFQLNHFPGSFQLGRKDRLWRNLSKMQVSFGKKEFGFFPQTYVLPQDLKQLKRTWEDSSSRQKWIIKPVSDVLSGACHWFFTGWNRF